MCQRNATLSDACCYPWMVGKWRVLSGKKNLIAKCRSVVLYGLFVQMRIFSDVLRVLLIESYGSIHLNSPGRKNHEDTNWHDSLHRRAQPPAGFHIWAGDFTGTFLYLHKRLNNRPELLRCSCCLCHVWPLPSWGPLCGLALCHPTKPLCQGNGVSLGHRHESLETIRSVWKPSGRKLSRCHRKLRTNFAVRSETLSVSTAI